MKPVWFLGHQWKTDLAKTPFPVVTLLSRLCLDIDGIDQGFGLERETDRDFLVQIRFDLSFKKSVRIWFGSFPSYAKNQFAVQRNQWKPVSILFFLFTPNKSDFQWKLLFLVTFGFSNGSFEKSVWVRVRFGSFSGSLSEDRQTGQFEIRTDTDCLPIPVLSLTEWASIMFGKL